MIEHASFSIKEEPKGKTISQKKKKKQLFVYRLLSKHYMKSSSAALAAESSTLPFTSVFDFILSSFIMDLIHAIIYDDVYHEATRRR